MFKLSEIYKDMDEIIVLVESFKRFCDNEEFELIKLLFGVAENKAVTEVVMINNKEVLIDKSIAHLIKELNNKGIETIASCSGLLSEHIDGFKPVSGYLAVAYNYNLFNYLKENLIDEVFTIENTEVYLQDAISIHIKTIDENVLKDKWNIIRKMFVEFGNIR